MPIHYRNALIIVGLIMLTYFPILSNRYIGDDHFIIEQNQFYSSWKNAPRLLQKGSMTSLQAIEYNSSAKTFDFGTGSVSYRPMSNLFYFLDYSLFKARPSGSHVMDLLFHCENSVLVYWIVSELFSSSAFGLFAGLLFSLHPIQSEAVAVMSYRADIVAAFFALCSFCFWFKEYYGWALLMYFLAVFSKESAVVLPLAILLFDRMFTPQRDLRLKRHYIGFIVIAVFYLYLYFIVFTNSSLSFNWLGGSFINHCITMLYIFYGYIINFLCPWTVKLIPGLYCPTVTKLTILEGAGMGGMLILLMLGAWFLWRNSKPAAFFFFWFILFYLPVSNVVPIANPVASRFMYLPSVGLLIAVAWILHKAFNSHFLKKFSPHLSFIFHAAIICICVTCTLFLNSKWKSDFDVGYAWAESFPRDYRGYGLLGHEYFKSGHFKEAKEYLEKSIRLGDKIPIDVFTLAQCYIALGQLQDAEVLLKQIISYNPDYADPYFGLAVVYHFQHKTLLEQDMLQKGRALNPKNPMIYTNKFHQLMRY
jgi:hypothetical protein